MHPVINSLIHSFIGSLNGSLNHSFTHSYSCHFISLRFTSFLFNPCNVSFHFHVILHCSFRFISFQVRNGFIQSCMHYSFQYFQSFHFIPLHSTPKPFHSIPSHAFISCHVISFFYVLHVICLCSLFMNSVWFIHFHSFMHSFDFISYRFHSVQLNASQFNSFTHSLFHSIAHSVTHRVSYSQTDSFISLV